MPSSPSSSSQPTTQISFNEISGPQSPQSPTPEEDERRGRTRTRQPPKDQPNIKGNVNGRINGDAGEAAANGTAVLEGYHSFESMGRRFTIENRWKLVREMGIGAFGAVVSAQDTISEEHVAIKQVNRVYDKPQLARRALREITLLRHFQSHPNVTGLIDLDSLSKQANEIYIFMEPMEADLHQIIRSGQDLSTDHIAYFMYQIISAMKFVHGCHVIHRDLKPGNILVNATCEIRICDFGLARGWEKPIASTGEGIDNDQQATPLTDYVATRWYRAPEIMLGFEGYDESIDMWSVGCILGELLGGKPIFQGRDYVDQLKCIFEYLGSPDDDIVKRIAKGRARKYVRSLPMYKSKPFKLAKADEQSLDLMSKLLLYLPEERLSASQSLEHPYLGAFYDPEDDYFAPQPVPFSRWREIEALRTVEEFRETIWAEIQDYRTQARSMAAEASLSPVVSIRQPFPVVRETIMEEEESEQDGDEQPHSPVKPFHEGTRPEESPENSPLFMTRKLSNSRSKSQAGRSRSSHSASMLSPVRTPSAVRALTVEGEEKQEGKDSEPRGRSGRYGHEKETTINLPTSSHTREDTIVQSLKPNGVSPARSQNATSPAQQNGGEREGSKDSRPSAPSRSPILSRQPSAVPSDDSAHSRPVRPRMASEADRRSSYFSGTPIDDRRSWFNIQGESTGAIPRPRKVSQVVDPYGTFSRRSSAIFGGPSVALGGSALGQSPAASSIGIFPGSGVNSFTQFPVLDEDGDTPSVAVPVRSRLPSMVGGPDANGWRHLRTLSTISIHERAERPGGLAALGTVGRLVGAKKTDGADGPPSDVPDELKGDD